MSSRKRQKQENQAARARAAAQRRRQRMTLTYVLVAVVILAAGGITAAVYLTQRTVSDSRDYALPAGATRDSPGLSVSHGPVKVDVYLDYMCPHCREFEELAGSALDQFTTDQRIRLVYHPLNFLNRYSAGSDYSTRAASAAGCAADAGKLPEFTNMIFQRQPKENTPGLTDKQIVAAGHDAHITAASFGRCVRSHKYAAWVRHVSNEALNRGVHQTPTVFVNGKKIKSSATALTNAVNAAA